MSHVRRKPTKRPVKPRKKKPKRNWIALIILILIFFGGVITVIFYATIT